MQLIAQNMPADNIERYNSIFFYQSVKPESQDWEKEPPVFPNGHYYRFNGIVRNGTTYLQEVTRPDLILGYLLGQGIEIEDAWYRPYATHCGPLEVMVGSSLDIRIKSDKHNELLNKYGFVKAAKPSAGCPNNVIHYSFIRKN